MGKSFTFSVEQETNTEPHWIIETEKFISNDDDANDSDSRELKVRLDKWLWAARFFKTRALARTAIENSKVLYDGQKVKPSLEIQIGASVQICQGKFEKFVVIKGLSTRRRNSDDAMELFEELPAQELCFNDNPTYPMRSGSEYYNNDSPYSNKINNYTNNNISKSNSFNYNTTPDNYGNSYLHVPNNNNSYPASPLGKRRMYQGSESRSHSNNSNNQSNIYNNNVTNIRSCTEEQADVPPKKTNRFLRRSFVRKERSCSKERDWNGY